MVVRVVWTFENWIAASGVTTNGGALDDADGDQLSNFIEYNLFGDLESPNASLTTQRQVSFGTPMAADYLALEFSTRSGISDTMIYVEAVDALSANSSWAAVWNSGEGALDPQVQSSSMSAERVDWVIRDTQTMEASDQRFMRVRVEVLED